MATPTWEAGHLYQPGDIVVPRSLSSTAQVPPTDPGFESGALGSWSETAVGGAASGAVSATYAFEGTKSYLWAGGAGSGQGGGIGVDLVNDLRVPVVPGQSITATCYCMSVPLHREHDVHSHVRIYWYNASNVFLSYTDSTSYGGLGNQFGTTGVWVKSTITGVAPANAAKASIGAFLTSDQGDANGAYVDGFSWNYVASTLPDGLVFRAVQAASGFSDASEPVWPVVAAATVVDNEVTWEAVYASRVVWTATPVLKSGAVEPTFPTVPGGTVVDGSVVWVAMDNRVKDEKCPNTAVVIIAASKVFAADTDIISFSATVNPLDWSTEGDAGYIPFGLQAYGATPVSALGLYRSNLVAANSKGYQMWQVDEDPANMALLDASPLDCPYHKSMQPVSNDLVLESSQGIRNIGIAGASTNLQAGFFGKQIDPLVKAARAALPEGAESRGLFYPGAGQYWLFYENQAFVLTMNGGPDDMSWGRYVFPYTIDDWTIHDAKLYLRAGTLVWEVSDEALEDDYLCTDLSIPVLSGAVQVDITTALLSWTTVAGATGYQLYNAATDALIIDTTNMSYLATGLTGDTEYRYYVKAYDTIFLTDASNVVVLNTGHPDTITDIFTASGTWTKRVGLISADVYAIAGGAGGGSGDAHIGGESTLGGGGGGGAEYRQRLTILAASLGSTETVTVGAAGVGGAAAATVLNGHVDGNHGTNGGDSSFGVLTIAKGGTRGCGGSRSAVGATGAGGTGGTGGTGTNGGSGAGALTIGVIPAGSSSTHGGGGGGAGTGFDFSAGTNSTPSDGGAGGTSDGSAAGGAHGVTGPGLNGTSSAVQRGGGAGGGGGRNGATGQDGGNGGDYGGAGGGGGCCKTSVSGTKTSGKGGDGAPGIIIVVNHMA